MKKLIISMGALTILTLVVASLVAVQPDPATAQRPLPNSNGSVIFLPAVFSMYPATQPVDLTVLLKSRAFTPEPGLAESLAAELQLRRPGRTHVLMQFERIPTAAEREVLAKEGVDLLVYIPNLAWFASVPSDEATALHILELTPTRWLGPILPEDRIDPVLLAKGAGEWARNPDGTVKVKVTFFEDVTRDEAHQVMAQLKAEIESEFTTSPSYWISIHPTQIYALAERDEVQFVGFFPPPPTIINDGSTDWTGADDVQALGITGSGVIVSLWDEDEVDDAHDDLTGRVVFGETTGSTSEHSTHVACTMAGDGSADPTLSGYALGAPTIVSYNFRGIVPNEYAQALIDYGIQVANNSWGRVIGWWWCTPADGCDPARWTFADNQNLFGAYTLNAPEYDAFVRDDGLTIAWSVGNDRDDPRLCCNPPVDGNPDFGTDPADWDQGAGNNGYDTIGPRATAKNVIAVGAIVDGIDAMSSFSNWGPTDDGRIKPDLVAPGVAIRSCDDDANDGDPGDIDDGYVRISGTSMAAPAVSGSAALIIEQYDQVFGTDPLPSTIKALLVNEAVDLTDNPHTVGNDNLVGPDFIHGWGRIDVLASINRVRNEQVTEGSLDAGDPLDTYSLNVLPDTPRLRVTIAWDDEPAAENAAPALVNDLDLVLVDPDGVSHFPWTLDPNNPNTPATTGVDSTNNVEQVQVDDPIPGIWQVRVSPSSVPEGPQAYSLVPFQESVDLSLTKTGNPDPVAAGTDLTYTLQVTNDGPGEAIALTLMDTLPPEVTYVSDTTPGGCSQPTPGTLICGLGDLEVGVSEALDIRVTVDQDAVFDAGGPLTITNTAEVLSENPDTDVTDNTVSENTLVIAVADLETAKSDSADPAVAGEYLVYILQVNNHGPSSTSGMQVVDTLPLGVTHIDNNAGCVEFPTGTLTCDLEGLRVGDSHDMMVTVLIDADLVYNASGPITITNQASVENLAGPDPNLSNNNIAEETLVIAAADLEIVSFNAVAPPSEVLVSEPVEIALHKEITNNGPSAPMDVMLTKAATPPPGSIVTPTVSVVPELALGLDELRNVHEVFIIECGAAGHHVFSFTNEIQPLDAADIDPDQSNNSAALDLAVGCVVPVVVNIKPGSYPNSINPRSRDVIPLAILTTVAGEYDTPLDFDATTIDPLSVRFGPRDVVWTETGGAFEAHDRGHIEDSMELDESTMDGDDDVVLHFHVRETGIGPGDTEACVKGEWIDAGGNVYRFFGCDTVRIMPGGLP